MQLLFPYEKVRESQKELIEDISKTLENKANLIAHAPTGIGKTIAALAPSLTHAIENNLTVIFVTPRHTQHKIAVETLKLIKQKFNLDFITIDLIGKKNMCAQKNAFSMPQATFSNYCRKLVEDKECDYYNNVERNKRLTLETVSLLKELEHQILHVEELKEISSKKSLCPFEIAFLLGKKAKVIIADYNHLVNPSIRATLFDKINKKLENTILIFDEAHNLPKKCREVLSSEISTKILDFAAKEAKNLKYIEIHNDILKISNVLEELTREKTSIETKEALIKKEEFTSRIESFIEYPQLAKDLAFIAEQTKEEKKRSFAETVYNFMVKWPGPDKAFVRILKKEFDEKGLPVITLSYKCMDPSLIIKPLAEETYSSIFMSGTLTPTEMYKDLFNIKSETKEYKNPFPKDNKLNIIVPDTTTKFTVRSREMFSRIAEYCSQISNQVPGNVAIFFPSYKIRDSVNEHFQNKCNKTTFLESSKLSKREKTEMIEKFKSYNGAVLLGASSGNFGEGLDIENNILKCVIVVGIPLGKPDLETQELIKYYNERFNKGWDYGYIMPALIKTLQNAGRCIRSETDKGVIIYLDLRYIWTNYFKCFPKDIYLRITKEPVPKIKEFFT